MAAPQTSSAHSAGQLPTIRSLRQRFSLNRPSVGSSPRSGSGGAMGTTPSSLSHAHSFSGTVRDVIPFFPSSTAASAPAKQKRGFLHFGKPRRRSSIGHGGGISSANYASVVASTQFIGPAESVTVTGRSDRRSVLVPASNAPVASSTPVSRKTFDTARPSTAPAADNDPSPSRKTIDIPRPDSAKLYPVTGTDVPAGSEPSRPARPLSMPPPRDPFPSPVQLYQPRTPAPVYDSLEKQAQRNSQVQGQLRSRPQSPFGAESRPLSMGDLSTTAYQSSATPVGELSSFGISSADMRQLTGQNDNKSEDQDWTLSQMRDAVRRISYIVESAAARSQPQLELQPQPQPLANSTSSGYPVSFEPEPTPTPSPQHPNIHLAKFPKRMPPPSLELTLTSASPAPQRSALPRSRTESSLAQTRPRDGEVLFARALSPLGMQEYGSHSSRAERPLPSPGARRSPTPASTADSQSPGADSAPLPSDRASRTPWRERVAQRAADRQQRRRSNRAEEADIPHSQSASTVAYGEGGESEGGRSASPSSRTGRAGDLGRSVSRPEDGEGLEEMERAPSRTADWLGPRTQRAFRAAGLLEEASMSTPTLTTRLYTSASEKRPPLSGSRSSGRLGGHNSSSSLSIPRSASGPVSRPRTPTPPLTSATPTTATTMTSKSSARPSSPTTALSHILELHNLEKEALLSALKEAKRREREREEEARSLRQELEEVRARVKQLEGLVKAKEHRVVKRSMLPVPVRGRVASGSSTASLNNHSSPSHLPRPQRTSTRPLPQHSKSQPVLSHSRHTSASSVFPPLPSNLPQLLHTSRSFSVSPPPSRTPSPASSPTLRNSASPTMYASPSKHDAPQAATKHHHHDEQEEDDAAYDTERGEMEYGYVPPATPDTLRLRSEDEEHLDDLVSFQFGHDGDESDSSFF